MIFLMASSFASFEPTTDLLFKSTPGQQSEPLSIPEKVIFNVYNSHSVTSNLFQPINFDWLRTHLSYLNIFLSILNITIGHSFLTIHLRKKLI